MVVRPYALYNHLAGVYVGGSVYSDPFVKDKMTIPGVFYMVRLETALYKVFAHYGTTESPEALEAIRAELSTFTIKECYDAVERGDWTIAERNVLTMVLVDLVGELNAGTKSTCLKEELNLLIFKNEELREEFGYNREGYKAVTGTTYLIGTSFLVLFIFGTVTGLF